MKGAETTVVAVICFFFQAEDGIRDLVRSRGLGDVYKRQHDEDEIGITDDFQKGTGRCGRVQRHTRLHAPLFLSLIHI